MRRYKIEISMEEPNGNNLIFKRREEIIFQIILYESDVNLGDVLSTIVRRVGFKSDKFKEALP